jgi:predicted MPP superfamily phosphohydrolase
MNKRKNHKKKMPVIILSFLTVSLIFWVTVLHLSNSVHITKVNLSIGKLDNPIKLLLFSDLHSDGTLKPGELDKYAKLIQKQNADIICFTGDAISYEPEETKPLPAFFSSLHAPLGLFAVPGNHDYRDGKQSLAVIKILTDAGFKVAINDYIEVKNGNDSFYIIGLDDFWRGKQDYQKAMNFPNKDQLSILLTHNAENIEELVSLNPDLILSGHTHGGQIYIPYLLDGIYKTFAHPDYMMGKYELHNTILYVNRGLRTNNYSLTIAGKEIPIPKIRLFASPEITVFTIK